VVHDLNADPALPFTACGRRARGRAVSIASLLAPLRIPLQAVEDLRSIAVAVTSLPRLVDQLETMRQLVSAVDAKVAKLGDDLASLPAHLDRANEQLAGVSTDLGQMRKDLGTTLPQKLDGLTGQIGGLSGQIGDMTGDLGQMRRDLGETLRNVEPVDDDLRSVEEATRALVPKIEELREHVDLLRSDLSGLPFVGKSKS